MQLDDWFEHARRDAVRRGLTGLEPLLDMLLRATRTLRAADWARAADEDAAGRQAATGQGAGAVAGHSDGPPPASPGTPP